MTPDKQTDVVERLREQAAKCYHCDAPEWCGKAADEIERLRAQVDAMRKALRNAEHALGYWQREALVRGKDAAWIKGPLDRGAREIGRIAAISGDAK